MNAQVKKEIRLLLPSWVAALPLAFAPIVLPPAGGIIVLLACFGLVMLVMMAVNSAGREFSLGTFSPLLAQPLSRARTWWTKVSVLALAQLIVVSIWCACLSTRFAWYRQIPGTHWQQIAFMVCVFTVVLAAYSGGLWTSLLFRQVAPAFLMALLVPAALFALVVVVSFTAECSDTGENVILLGVFWAYAIGGFWWARHLFLRAQDVGWTGGTVSLPDWPFSRAQSSASGRRQRRKPIAALFWKELQLHQPIYAIAGALLALHLVIIFIRTAGHESLVVLASLENFWLVWLVMPVIVGCTAVAEERKLGVAEEQLCLPVSSRVQFTIKFLLAVVLGTLLGGVLPCLIEGCAIALGAPKIFNGDAVPWLGLSISACSLGVATVAFFASTLARNFLQALAIAVAAIVACAAFIAFVSTPQTVFGITLWRYVLADVVGVLTMVVAFVWLAYGNLKNVDENWRVWRRNLVGLTTALAFAIVASAALYNRIWENFTPMEPRHGAARLTLSKPPVVRFNYGSVIFKYDLLTVLLPNGRVWLDEVGPPSRRPLWAILAAMFHTPPGGLALPGSLGPNQFIDGSNWTDVTADTWDFVHANDGHAEEFAELIGIRSGGSLWVSERMDEAPLTIPQLTKFGSETNWQAVVAGGWPVSAVLLKKDGTLWRWGPKDWVVGASDWLALRAFKPYRLGTNSDWAQIFSLDGIYARRTDGTAWTIASDGFVQTTNLDQTQWRSLAWSDWRRYLLGVRDDGTLWIYRENERLQVAIGTDWTAVAGSLDKIVALKSDGSLWQWKSDLDKKLTLLANTAPTRLGIHSDWVAVADDRDGVISLAADGSLWYWPDKGVFESSKNLLMLKPSRKPELLANIFDPTK
jgi:hypothetical protein